MDVVFIQANVRSNTEGDVRIMLNIPKFDHLPLTGWTLFDLHNGELKMHSEGGKLMIDVLPGGAQSHPAGLRMVDLLSGLYVMKFPLKARFQRFLNTIEFKVGPFQVTLESGFTKDFLTGKIKPGETLNSVDDLQETS